MASLTNDIIEFLDYSITSAFVRGETDSDSCRRRCCVQGETLTKVVTGANSEPLRDAFGGRKVFIQHQAIASSFYSSRLCQRKELFFQLVKL